MAMHPDPDGIHRQRLTAQGRRGRARRGRRRRRVRGWLLTLPLLFIALSLALTAGLRQYNPPTTAFMLAARIEAMGAGGGVVTLEYEWLPLALISGWAGAAVIAAEDQKFAYHHGFDLDAVAGAWQTQAAGGPLRGASTISQQLAKNLFLWSGRNWLRKGLEAWFTVLLETFLSKSRLLELYLNVVEFGPGVYGVGAASRHYFGHSAAGLSADEAAALAAVLPSPRTFSVTAPSPYMRARQHWIARQMLQLGGIDVVARLPR